jgi:NAD(P)-dependent dehydrogenase (short-subunit alcohol dehydrogenase family)
MVKTSLVLGGNGALGRSLVKVMKQGGWNVVCLDLVSNTEANANVIVDPSIKLKD